MSAVALFHGDRAELAALFLLADDSATAVASYIAQGELLVLRMGGHIVGQVQIVETNEPSTRELKSLAVLESRRGQGLGVTLVAAAVAHARLRGLPATASGYAARGREHAVFERR